MQTGRVTQLGFRMQHHRKKHTKKTKNKKHTQPNAHELAGFGVTKSPPTDETMPVNTLAELCQFEENTNQ